MGFSATWIIIAVLVVAIGVVFFVYNRLKNASKRPEYLQKYVDHVLSAFLESARTDATIAAIVTKYENPETRKDVTWAELFAVESYLLSKQDVVTLRRRAWSLRDKFREVVGQRQYENYLLSRPPNENEADPDIPMLRADLEWLLDSLHWSYSLIPVRERLRAQIITFVSGGIIAWTLVAVGLVLWSAHKGQPLLGTLVVVLLAGAMGGFVSLLRRIQMVPGGGDPLLSIFELENGRVSLYLAPMSGALFALVLFFIFQGGLLRGELFPELGGFALNLWGFKWPGDFTPAKAMTLVPPHGEYAKLLVWSFIAGFAERLVPDTLARLVARGEEANAAPRTPPPPGLQTADTTSGTRLASPPRATGATPTSAPVTSPPTLPRPRIRLSSPPFP